MEEHLLSEKEKTSPFKSPIFDVEKNDPRQKGLRVCRFIQKSTGLRTQRLNTRVDWLNSDVNHSFMIGQQKTAFLTNPHTVQLIV